VDSAALNPSDILFMKGLYNIKLKYPYTPGWEGSGTVVEVGPGLLSSYFKDKRVAFNKQFELGTYQIGGAFAEYCVTDVRSCIPLNDSISLEQGAALFVNPLTAVGMVDRAK
jgi:NADPH:quinone reductase-like Zn-dependent oxidoreductase